MDIIFGVGFGTFLLGGVSVFLFGTIVGSFLNVVALRYNTGLGINGRSRCFSCEQPLQWFELVPVFSFVFLRGRCHTCGSLLSLQYPSVELLTGTLFVALFMHVSSVAAFMALAIIFSLYIVIGIYDIRHAIVPNGLSYAAALFSFLLLFVGTAPLAFHMPGLLEVFAGPLVALPLFLLWLVSRGTWMGLGDAKLMLSVGWLLGISGGSAALTLAFWSGALFGVFFLLFRSEWIQRLLSRAGKKTLPLFTNHPTIKSEIPFAPFLLLGFFTAFFLNLTIFKILLWSLW